MAAPAIGQDYNVPFRPRAAAAGGGSAVAVAAKRFTIATTDGANTDLAFVNGDWSSGVAETPELVLVLTHISSDSEGRFGAIWTSIGAGTSGSARWYYAYTTDDVTSGNINADRIAGTDNLIELWGASQTAGNPPVIDMTVDLDETTPFSSNNIRVDVDDAPAGDRDIWVIAFAGTDFEGAVGTLTTATGNGGTTSVTGLSFQPHVGFFVGDGPFDGTITPHIDRSIGLAIDDASDTNFAQGYVFTDNVATTDGGAYYHNDRIHVDATNAGALTHSAELTAWNSDGITVTSRSAQTATEVGYVLMYFGSGVTLYLAEETFPTATGDYDFTGMTVQPDFILGFYTDNTTAAPDGDGGNLSENFITHFLTRNAQTTLGVFMAESVASTSNSHKQGLCYNTVTTSCHFNAPGTLTDESTWSGTQSTSGWTFNFTDAPDAAYKYYALAVKF